MYRNCTRLNRLKKKKRHETWQTKHNMWSLDLISHISGGNWVIFEQGLNIIYICMYKYCIIFICRNICINIIQGIFMMNLGDMTIRCLHGGMPLVLGNTCLNKYLRQKYKEVCYLFPNGLIKKINKIWQNVNWRIQGKDIQVFTEHFLSFRVSINLKIFKAKSWRKKIRYRTMALP